MRALVKTSAGPGLDWAEVPEPPCGPTDVKVRVLRAGLCGTDLHIRAWDPWAAATLNPPLVVGHEFYGEVVEVGEDVPAGTVSIGDRVSGEGHVVCGHCRNCRAGRRHLCINTVGIGVNRDGAFADLVVIPASNAYVQPASMPRAPRLTEGLRSDVEGGVVVAAAACGERVDGLGIPLIEEAEGVRVGLCPGDEVGVTEPVVCRVVRRVGCAESGAAS